MWDWLETGLKKASERVTALEEDVEYDLTDDFMLKSPDATLSILVHNRKCMLLLVKKG